MHLEIVGNKKNQKKKLSQKSNKMWFLNVIPNNKKTPVNRGFYVVPPGVEPGTHGFSVHCSTN